MTHKTIFYLLPFWLWTIALFTGTSLPGSSITLPDFQFSDKVAHFVAYGGVGFLFLRLIPHLRHSFWKFRPISKTILLGVLMGIIDELHQIFIPGRDASFADLVADFLGVLIGVILYRIIKRHIPVLS